MSGAYTLLKRSDMFVKPPEHRAFGTDSLITGEGHGHYRPPDKTERCHKQKKKSASKMAKQSRRKNRR